MVQGLEIILILIEKDQLNLKWMKKQDNKGNGIKDNTTKKIKILILVIRIRFIKILPIIKLHQMRNLLNQKITIKSLLRSNINIQDIRNILIANHLKIDLKVIKFDNKTKEKLDSINKNRRLKKIFVCSYCLFLF
jgi:hypothetical protein